MIIIIGNYSAYCVLYLCDIMHNFILSCLKLSNETQKIRLDVHFVVNKKKS